MLITHSLTHSFNHSINQSINQSIRRHESLLPQLGVGRPWLLSAPRDLRMFSFIDFTFTDAALEPTLAVLASPLPVREGGGVHQHSSSSHPAAHPCHPHGHRHPSTQLACYPFLLQSVLAELGLSVYSIRPAAVIRPGARTCARGLACGRTATRSLLPRVRYAICPFTHSCPCAWMGAWMSARVRECVRAWVRGCASACVRAWVGA
eukprot:GHVU01184323.1.p1 GENE.GHVU01184323.1~~GHVU01184323.1.p1  ORF type:complete len:206 (-),score=0.72 GHVU01184323.1:14-631(-)